ncbi:MAG: hypothetical protein OEW75_03590 [Cyclobacteriaceae bacterium]|nr:hypothetical protein [Cyclobacteriaceae bacterium]
MKLKKSTIIPLSLIVLIIIGIILLGRLGNYLDNKIILEGVEGYCDVFNEGKRMIRIKYDANGKQYITGVGKGYSGIFDGEQFTIKYLVDNPKSVFVFWDKPYFSKNYSYEETECIAISKKLSIIYFEYLVNGKRIERETLFRDHTLDKYNYKVRYRKENPEIGYLIPKQ